MTDPLFDSLDVGIVVVDANGCVWAWNDWIARTSRIPKSSAIGQPLQRLFPALSETRLPAAIEESIQLGSSSILTHSLNRLLPLWGESGHDLVHNVIVRPLNVGPSPRCLIQINDVTVHVNRERILRKRQNARYHAIVDSAPDAIITTGADGRIQWVNGAAERLFGYAPDELVGHPVHVLIDPQDNLVGAFDSDEASLPAERFFQVSGRRRDGSGGFFDVSLAGWRADDRVFVTSIWRDVSERIAVESALRDSEGRQRALLEALPQLVWTCEPDGSGDYFNPQWEAYTGLASETRIGLGWLDVIHERERTAFKALLISSLETGAIFDTEARLRRRDGAYRWFKVRSVPVRTAAGAITRWFGTATEITDLVEARETLRRSNDELEARVVERTREREVMLAQLHEAQKMESLGQLTGGVAHDFNNLLAVILGNLRLVKKRLPQDPRMSRFVDAAIQGAERGATLTKRLLAFARRQELKLEAVDIHRLIPEMLDFLRQSVGPNIQVKIDIVPDVQPVQIDANQLELALMNLAVNARDAMPTGGLLTITCRNVSVGDSRDAPHDLQPGDYVQVNVADTGHGMDEVTLAKAREPFFTTKGVGKGTGLGLSMVHGLTAQSGGAMQIVSMIGEGTTVSLWLRRAAPSSVSDWVPSRAAAIPQGPTPKLKVLVVDDDTLVSRGAANLLADLGHSVTEAASGRQALQLIETSPAFDAVITDFAMPDMTGLDLALALRSRWPSLPVILASGYAELPGRAAGIGFPWLAKPYTQEELSAALIAAVTQEAPQDAVSS